jgi:hypothetical protein
MNPIIVEKLYKLFEVLIEHFDISNDDILGGFVLGFLGVFDKIGFANMQGRFLGLLIEFFDKFFPCFISV